MSITKLSSTEYYQIETLWLELNLLHGELSSEFKDHFATVTFEKRIESLLEKDSSVIFAASNDEDLIGYCIASINNEKGEIDSLYVKPSYRGKNQGKKIFIHCVVNARVSAFMYLYLTLVKGLNIDVATSPIIEKWLPSMDESWKSIMGLTIDKIEIIT